MTVSKSHRIVVCCYFRSFLAATLHVPSVVIIMRNSNGCFWSRAQNEQIVKHGHYARVDNLMNDAYMYALLIEKKEKKNPSHTHMSWINYSPHFQCVIHSTAILSAKQNNQANHFHQKNRVEMRFFFSCAVFCFDHRFIFTWFTASANSMCVRWCVAYKAGEMYMRAHCSVCAHSPIIVISDFSLHFHRVRAHFHNN